MKRPDFRGFLGRGCPHALRVRMIIDKGDACNRCSSVATEPHQHCGSCGSSDFPPPTFAYRKYLRLNKSVKMRTGAPKDLRSGRRLGESMHFVGLRFVVPGQPNAVKRVWISFDDKPAAKVFAREMQYRLSRCGSDDGYNAEIHAAIAVLREENPDITEQVSDVDET